MWTDENRGRYDRGSLRYPSDLTDEEWALVKPMILPPKRGGNKRTVDNGVRSRTICPRGAPSITISAAGGTTER